MAGALDAARGKSHDQLSFPCHAALGCVHRCPVLRPAERKGKSGYRQDQPRPEIVTLLRAQRGIHRRLWHTLEHLKGKLHQNH
jgi:hypothetical protein